MAWFWLNIPLAVLIFLAWTLIPLWIVVKHPDTGPGTPATDAPQPSAGTTAAPAYLPDSPRETALAGQH